MADTSDSESTNLVSSSGKQERLPDWGRFGLSKEQQLESQHPPHQDEVYQHDGKNKNELFAEDQSASSKPWWKLNFFISEPVLFGPWDGVFTSCMINIFGIIIFLRTGWMVGNAGIGLSILIICLTIGVALVSVLSAIGVCERCQMESGGIFFLLSHVLGAKIGASIGVIYCFGQAVSCSLYTMGFGESIAAFIDPDFDPWIARGIAAAVLLLLLGINIAGVKWVIRLQLLLLFILAVAVMDFAVGSFVHTDIEYGVTGYLTINLVNNTAPAYLAGESFFSVFGVFFPTATGAFAGINMSGDLRNPSKDIPVGTLAAVGVSTFLYLMFTMILGSTCARDYLREDYMIAEKVAALGFLFLAGLYISSISSCMGSLYGSPRILQSIAKQNVIPVIKFLGQGRGPNKVPVFALLAITVISLVFICIGNVNILAPIVTMPFMLTYASVDFAYFSLAMSFQKRKRKEERYSSGLLKPAISSVGGGVGGRKSDQENNNANHNYGSTDKVSNDLPPKNIPDNTADLDNLFPERLLFDQKHTAVQQKRSPKKQQQGSPVSKAQKQAENSGKEHVDGEHVERGAEADATTELLDKQSGNPKPVNTEIHRMPRSYYSIFVNRWLSLIGSIACLVIMFGIQWIYALVTVSVVLVIYIYISKVNPGVFPGIAEFSLLEWIRDGVSHCCRRGPQPAEEIVVTPSTPAVRTFAAQLTEDNDDFANRGRYHQSEIVQGENFDEFQDSD
ncbi:solute carrier family 12 member 8 isoform X2 [Lingula anatina]|nr:solute carrier family 12 member 8 isoform X2 [Lingula anatina]|eukprot:XP_013418011.1 solute carrier family 12 member 8 isoform X2 [Lingula anatina]